MICFVNNVGDGSLVKYHKTPFWRRMARPKKTVPSRLYHRPSKQDRVVWDGKTYYLGPHDSPEALAAYARIVQSILATGFATPPEPSTLTVAELANRYLVTTKKDFPATSKEPVAISRAVNEFARVMGDQLAEKISAGKFIEWRDSLVARGLSIKTINMKHMYVLNMFRWAALHEMIPASVWHLLQAVKRIKPGRSSAKQPKRVKPVDWAQVEAIKPYVSDRVWDVICLQWYTGMRAGEVLGMTPAEIVDGVYRPTKHKNAWRGHVREVHLGPHALQIVQRLSSGLEPGALLFGGMRSDTLWTAISRACKRAGVPPWHSHQLRHAAATRARAAYGLEGAQAMTGHATAQMAEHYAEKSADLAKKISRELG